MAKNTKPRFVRRVTGSLQGGVDIELGPRTLLVGRNASGKDSVVRALSLAVRGQVDDLAGSDNVKSQTVISELAPGRSRDLIVRALDSSGEQALYHLAMKGAGKTSRPKHEGFTSCYSPAVDVREKLRAGTAARRAWLLGLVGVGMSPERVMEALPGPIRPEYKAVLTALTSSDKALRDASPTEQMARVQAEAESRTRQAKKDARTYETVAGQATGTGGRPVPTAAEVEQLTLEVEQARIVLSQVPAVVQQAELPTLVSSHEIARLPVLDQQAADAAAAVAHGMQQREGIAAWLLQNPPIDDEVKATGEYTIKVQEAVKTAALAQVKGVTGGALSNCQLCNGELTVDALADADAAMKRAQDTIDGWTAYLAKSVERAQNEGYLRQWDAYIEQHQAKQHAATNAATDIRHRQAQQAEVRAAIRAEVDGLEQTRIEQTRQQAEQAYQTATERLSEARELRARSESTRVARDKIADANKRASRYDHLATTVREAGLRLLNEAVDAFVASVRAYMPPPEEMPGKPGTFAVSLTEGDRDVCDVGIERVDVDPETGEQTRVVHTALSGAEEVIVMTALACAVGEQASASLVVVTINERGIHPDDLGPAMRALSSAPCQIVWTNAVPPKGRKPKGWTVIDVGEYEPPADPFDSDGAKAAARTDAEEAAHEARKAAKREAREAGMSKAEAHAEGQRAAEEAEAEYLAQAEASARVASLPWWAQPDNRGEQRPPLRVEPGQDATAAMAATYPGITSVCAVHTDGEGKHWIRYLNGMIARLEGTKLAPYTGRASAADMVTEDPLPVPCWASGSERGVSLGVFPSWDDGAVKQLFDALGRGDADIQAETSVVSSYELNGVIWRQLAGGLLVRTGATGASIVWSGQVEMAPAVLARVKSTAGRAYVQGGEA